MGKLFYRVYVLLCMLVLQLKAVAQTDDDEAMDPMPGKGGGKEANGMDMLEDVDYMPIRITFDDVLTVVVLLVACYVFGKIWKGCSYLILILAGIFYFVIRG